jgi:hypothetical protein
VKPKRIIIALFTCIAIAASTPFAGAGWNPFEGWKPFKKPFGNTGLGVTARTPLGRNGLGYQPLKKPVGAHGKDIEKWVSKNRDVLIVAAVTVAAIAIVQPEIAAITWSDVTVVASSDGVAIGVSMSAASPKRGDKPSVARERYEAPMWPIGISPAVFQELKKGGQTGLDDPRIANLIKFMEHPTARKDFGAALEKAESLKWPSECNPKLVKVYIAMNRDVILPGMDFVYAYVKEKRTLVGAEQDPRFIAIQKKIDQHIGELAALKPSFEELKACNKGLEAELKRQAGARKTPQKHK